MNGKTRILIVEDDTPAAMMMVNVLTQAGCDVMVASRGKKGMELAQEAKFDLIVLAVNLPDTDGFKVGNELKQRHLTCHTPIIFISTQPREEERQRGFELGAVDYIVKPFDTVDFALRLLSHVKTANDPIAVAESTET